MQFCFACRFALFSCAVPCHSFCFVYFCLYFCVCAHVCIRVLLCWRAVRDLYPPNSQSLSQYATSGIGGLRSAVEDASCIGLTYE